MSVIFVWSQCLLIAQLQNCHVVISLTKNAYRSGWKLIANAQAVDVNYQKKLKVLTVGMNKVSEDQIVLLVLVEASAYILVE